MPTVGETLKQRRLERDLSIDEVAEITKISVYFLQALEHNEFKKLPRGAFPKMFVRSYARFLGLDDNKIIQMFYEQIAATETASDGLTISTPPPPRRKSHRLAQTVAALAIFASLAISAFLIYRAQEASEPDLKAKTATSPPARWTPQEASTQENPAATAAPAGTATPAEGTGQPAAPESGITPAGRSGFSFRLEAHDYCWVRLSLNESEQLDFILKPGERFQRNFDGEITMKLGNAGGVNLFLNDRAALPLGQRGEVVSVTLSPATLSRFLPKTQEP
jgi:cytoskeleton protein RodZ